MLSNNVHFVEQIACTAKLVHHPKHVPDVHANASLELRLKDDVRAHCLPVAVKGQTDQASVCVENRTAGVAAGDVKVGQEACAQLAVRVCVLAVVALGIEVLNLLRYAELVVPGSSFSITPLRVV